MATTIDVTFVDTNVLLDIFTQDLQWAHWSLAQIDAAALRGEIAINAVIYAELSVRSRDIETLEAGLSKIDVMMHQIPRAALFLAGKTFERYRRAGGSRTGVLPDFFIGAHAAVVGASLVTRDVRRYRSYFPKLDLITPWQG